MGHELRAPLSSILGLSKLLASGIDGALGPEQERQVAFIRRSAEDMLELVNDLLDLSRIDAGKLITHHFKLAEIEQAYETFSKAADTKALKVIIEA